MIKPLLFLFIALAHISALEYKIDYARCSISDMECFVSETCIENADSSADEKNLVLYDSKNTKLDGGKCPVIVQLKMLNKKQNKILVMMQIELPDLKTEDGLIIKQKQLEHISCKDKVKGNSLLTFEAMGEEPSLDSARMFCALTATVTQENAGFGTVFTDDIVDNDFPEIHFTTTGGGQVYTIESKRVFASAQYKCNTDAAESPSTSTDYSEWTEVDITRENIECPNPGQKVVLSYTENNQKIEKEVTKVKCNRRSNQYEWTDPAPGGKVPSGTDFVIGCAKKKFCSACTPLVEYKCPQCTPSSDKDKAGKAYDQGGCLIRKCDNTKDKWTLGGKDNVYSPGGVVCKNSGGTSKWFLLDTTAGTEVPSGGASCRDKSTCTTKGSDGKPVTFDCPDTETECAPPLYDTGINMTCPDGKVLYNNDAVAKSHDCDSATGYWMESGNFYCALAKPESASVAPSTGGASSGVVAGGILGALVVIGAIGGAVYFFVLKPRMAAKASKAAGPSKKGGKSSKKSTESKSGAKKPSDSDPPEKAASGKEGAAATPADGATPGGATPGPTPTTDLEKIKTEPSAPKTPAEPAAAVPATPGAPPPPPAAV